MYNNTLKYSLSLVITFCGSLLVFCNPVVFLRTIFPVAGLAEIIGFFLFIVLFLSVILLVYSNGLRVNKYGVYLLIFCILSQFVFIISDYSFKILIQSIPTYLILVAITVYGLDITFIHHLIKAFTFAMILHFLSIYSGLDFIQRGIDLNTQYGISSSLVGRSSGFTSAPGVLSLYSSIGVAIGMIMISRERRILWILLLVFSFFCGIGTLNRTFIVAVSLFIIVLFPILMTPHYGLIKSMFLSCFIALLSVIIIFLNGSYTERIFERFESSTLKTDMDVRMKGTSGFLPMINAVLKNPLIGPLRYNHDLGKAVVFVNGTPVTPSNGFVAIFASRGVVFGGLFFFWTYLACLRFWRASNALQEPYMRIFSTALLGGYLVGQIVCLFDALLENSVMMFLILFGLASRRLAINRSNNLL